MSAMLKKAQEIGADFALIVKGKDAYMRFYKKGSFELSRNCMLYWNESRRRWDNSSELNFYNTERSMRTTGRSYSIVDFRDQSRKDG